MYMTKGEILSLIVVIIMLIIAFICSILLCGDHYLWWLGVLGAAGSGFGIVSIIKVLRNI